MSTQSKVTTYYPNMEDFKDFAKFIKSIEDDLEQVGLAKVYYLYFSFHQLQQSE